VTQAPLCLGIDADPIGRDGSGNETYLRGIVGALQPLLADDESVVLTGRNTSALQEVAGPRTQVVGLSPGWRGELGLGRGLARAGATVALGHYVSPVGFAGSKATVIHDVAYLRVPETYPAALRLRLRATVHWSVRQSAVVVTVSHFSKSELLACYRQLTSDRVVVTPDAPDPAFFEVPSPDALMSVRQRYQLPERFALTVGNLQPRKNLPRLCEAATTLGLPLVVVGQDKWRVGDTVKHASWSGIQLVGYVPRAHLVCLYRLCQVFVYPSLYEGFGLPVVEAMAAGAPVVTSTTGALAEVAGGAAVLVDPESVEAIAEGMDRVVSSSALAASLAAGGTQRAAEFSWTKSAGVLLESMRQVNQARP
jgi:glycosyltransferase involved in cell wall biosynthesis